MTRSIAKDSLTIFTAKFITSFLIFLTGILIARSFGPAGVGTYDLFIAIINFSVMLGSFGIGIASVYLLNRKKEPAAQLFFHILCIGTAWGIILAGLAFFVFSRFSFLPQEFPLSYVLFAAFAIPFVLLQNYLLPFLLAKFRTYQWSFFSILYAGLIFGGAFFALKIAHSGLNNVVYVVVVSGIITATFLMLSVFRITSLRLQFSRPLFAEQLRIGFTSYLGDIFQVANFKLNLFFVGMFLSIARVGYYSVALNIANVFLIVPYAFQQVLYSTWSLLAEKDVDKNTPAMARQTLLVAIITAALVFLVGKYVVVNVLYGKGFSPSIAPLALLLPGAVCIVFAGIFFNNFYSRGKAHVTTGILFFVSLLNIVLNVFLIPRFGIAGAAVATSLSYALAALLGLFFFSRMSNYAITHILRFQSSDIQSLLSQFRRFSGFDYFSQRARKSNVHSLAGKIKVCHVASADISLRFLIFSQLKYLQRMGFDVHTVSSDGKWVPDITKAGIPHTTVRIVRKVFTPLADFIAFFRLFFLFKKEKFHIVHTHTLKAGLLGSIAAFFAGVPVRIYTIHGLDFLNTSFPSVARQVFKLVDRVISRFVDLMFSVNKETIEIVQKERIYPAEKTAYAGVGIDLEKFNPSRFDSVFIARKKTEIGVPLDAKVVGMVGRLVKEKGYLELFEAFHKVLKKFPNAFLAVVGGAEPEKRDNFDMGVIRNYGIEKNVVFLGERRDVDELMAVFDVLVLPSYREGLGITLVEASAMKKPVIASDISGCREAVENGETGILISPKNPEKLAEAIIYLFSNPERARQIGEAGRKKVELEFDEKVVFERIRREYGRLLKAKLRV